MSRDKPKHLRKWRFPFLSTADAYLSTCGIKNVSRILSVGDMASVTCKRCLTSIRKAHES